MAMQAFLVSFSSVAIAEMGDRTQLLSMMLAARYRQPWPIIAGILAATLANHAAAGFIGSLLGGFLTPAVLDAIVGVSMLAMALWTLKPDTLDEDDGSVTSRRNVFMATLIAFFIAEMGDKTQVATMALAAAYPSLLQVVVGTTLGMMAANVPVVFLGKAFSDRLPLRALNIGAALLFAVLGVIFLVSAVRHWV
jgi:putative Ca2+/H+ antiporter (TMEM165/GDT1 family)